MSAHDTATAAATLDEERDATTTTVAVLDLPDRLRVVSASPRDTQALVTVREEGQVLADLRLPSTEDIPGQVASDHRWTRRRRAWRRGGGRHLTASVILCTTGTSPLLAQSVRAVLDLDADGVELIVVDNAPRSGAARAALAGFEDPRLRIVDEPTAGLSRARNTGVAAASGSVIAFTDDDAVVDRSWLSEMLDVFAADPDERLGAVTGSPRPAQLQYRSQRMFEARGGFPSPTQPALWATGEMPRSVRALAPFGHGGPLYPVVTARVGAGVAMAFRQEALKRMGPFDESLGAGTLATGGEDLDAFARLLRLGYGILQTPDALVHHYHRPSMAALTKQTRADGAGVAALLTKTLVTHPRAAMSLVRRVPAVARRVAPGSPRMRGTDPDVPTSLCRAEVGGFLAGPALYARSRWESRSRAQSRGRGR